MTTTEQIYQEIDSLSEEAKRFLLDFIELLKQRYPQPNLKSEHGIDMNQGNDPLIGLFAGSPTLATEAEDILETEIQAESGWTWKE